MKNVALLLSFSTLVFLGATSRTEQAFAAEKYYCKSYCAVYYGGRLQIGQNSSGWVESWSNDPEQAWNDLKRKCHWITGYSNLNGRLQVGENNKSYPSPEFSCFKF